MSLRSPSGRTIHRSTTAEDVHHRVGPRQELYVIQNPEQGTWEIDLHGTDVPADGEPVTLSVHEEAVPNKEPVASVEVSQDDRTVVVDAAASSDADGEIVEFLWEFGDGTFASTAQATHTYDAPGDYLITLGVTDDDGGMGFAEHAIHIPGYDFEGFLSPVSNPPAVNVVKAGRAIPVKFRLGGDRGLDVLDEGSPAVRRLNCEDGQGENEVEGVVSAGGSSLTYDSTSDTYTYVWKTDKSWANSCRRLVLRLNDGSSHVADFELR